MVAEREHAFRIYDKRRHFQIRFEYQSFGKNRTDQTIEFPGLRS